MRIVIDLQGSQSNSRHRGIGRYSLAFARAFCEQAVNHEVHVLLNGSMGEAIGAIREALAKVLPANRIAIWNGLRDVQAVDPASDGRRLVSELIREASLRAMAPDLVIVSSLFEGAGDDAVTSVGRFCDLPTAAILYDLIPLEEGDDYLADPRIAEWYRDKLEHLARCNHILAISEESLSSARRLLGFPADRGINIGAAIDDDFAGYHLHATPAGWGIVRPYFLYVSGIDRRKNHHGLITAWGLVPERVRDGHQLVLAGHMTLDHVAELREAGRRAGLRESDIAICRDVPEQDLRSLYAGCKCFVFPSMKEGFGLPILEAMAFSKPVIASRVPVVREVHGWDEALFDPQDPHEIAAAITRVATDPSWASRLAEFGSTRLPRYSWSAVAKRALSYVERLADGTASGTDRADVRRALTARLRGSQALESAGFTVTAQAIAGSFRVDDRPRLLVDISELVNSDAGTGIQRVVRTILSHWLAEPPGNWRIEPVYATLDRPGFHHARRFTDRFVGAAGTVRADTEVMVWPGDRFLALDLQSHILPAQRRTLQEWRDRGVIAQAVVYDLLPVTMPHNFRAGWAEAHASWLRTIGDLDGAISISRAVASEFAHWRATNIEPRARPFRNGWFHLGSDFANNRATRGLPGKARDLFAAMAARPTFLMVGTLEPRKAHGEVLDAFEDLWLSGADAGLVIVGRMGWNTEDLCLRLSNHPERDVRLHWIEDASDEYLQRIYGAAACLLLASHGEGFGLPIIEAASRGLPLLLRDLPVFREVAGANATYFESGAGLCKEVLARWLERYRNERIPLPETVIHVRWEDAAARLFSLAAGLADEDMELI